MRPLFEERPNRGEYESFLFKRRLIQRSVSPEMCVTGNTKSLPVTRAEVTHLYLLPLELPAKKPRLMSL